MNAFIRERVSEQMHEVHERTERSKVLSTLRSIVSPLLKITTKGAVNTQNVMRARVNINCKNGVKDLYMVSLRTGNLTNKIEQEIESFSCIHFVHLQLSFAHVLDSLLYSIILTVH